MKAFAVFIAIALPFASQAFAGEVAYTQDELGYGDGGLGKGPSDADNATTSVWKLRKEYKVVPELQKHWDRCTKEVGLGNCQFYNPGVLPDKYHIDRESCHNTHQAVDISTLLCDGGTLVAPQSKAYLNVIRCLAKTGTLKVLHVVDDSKLPADQKMPADGYGYTPGKHVTHMHVELLPCDKWTGRKAKRAGYVNPL